MPRLILLSNARSGSSYLSDLLNCHPEIEIAEELLNDEVKIEGDTVTHLEKELSKYPQTYVGFKVFPEQIFQLGLNFSSLVQEIGATHVIVLWREGLFETLASRRIADKTGIWYSTSQADSKNIEKIHIDPGDLAQYSKTVIAEWGKIGDQWPVGIQPIFCKFEDLVANPNAQVRHILSRLSCPNQDRFDYSSPAQRQNPSKLDEKVTNFHDLCPNLRDKKLQVGELLGAKIKTDNHFQLASEVLPFVPDREPCMPPGGWRYRVAEPFMPSNLKQNVYDAVESGSVSSAGFWPRLMASKLKELFKVPVAQPCSNGFTALMLAMQCANITEGDEVIMPSMTMVAVPNATHFLGARPVFADCSLGDYNPGWDEIEMVSTEKTKAVIVTHTYGVPTPNMDKILSECIKRNWWLIEDISECVGVKTQTISGTDKLLGTFGHFACASMYVNKMIHAGDGGFVIAKDPKLAIRLTSLINHGFTPSYHFVHFEPALNAKINGLGAAMACGCIDEIQSVMTHRTEVSQMYRQALADLPTTIKLMPSCGPEDTPWVFGVEFESKQKRTELRSFLAERGIETRDYFFALHLQPAFYSKESSQRLPISEKLGSTGFYLPTHSNLKSEDVFYITSCLKQFFEKQEDKIIPVPSKKANLSIQIQPDSFRVNIREFNESGTLNQAKFRGHVYIEAVKMGLTAEEIIIHERWDEKISLIKDMKNCLKDAKDMKMESTMEMYFEPYLKYFESQDDFEPSSLAKPWLQVDLNSENLKSNIPTTTDSETLQLLLWIIQETRPETIWEIGCWMGHASKLMASFGKSLGIRQKIFTCDAFKWQDWMASYVKPEMIMQPGQSFLQLFKTFTQEESDSIETVKWPYDISKLPTILSNQKPNLIFLDITQEEEEIEAIWQMMLPNLIPNETIILFNGLSHTSIPFFTRHSKELKAFAKPNTIAKAFIFVVPKIPKEEVDMINTEGFVKLPKKLNFQNDPGWTHHHKNLFCSSVAILRNRFHDPNAPILFFPAVEEQICDDPESFLTHPWIGIAHSVPDYPELFYTPDLRRLCSSRYASIMRNCKGLFTLTELQANFFNDNLPKEFTFPIQPLKYPVEPIAISSTVPESFQNGNKVPIDLVFIGSFARDFQLFFDTHVPSNFRKVLIAGDDISKNAAEKAPSEFIILERLTGEEYEAILTKSIVFLALTYDGAANTIILECIARNIPILSPRLSSCTEYLGTDYPLLYDPAKPQLDELLTLENIENAIFYLKSKDKSPLSTKTFIDDFQNGAVLISVPPMPETKKNFQDLTTPGGIITSFPKYDVTLCICSYQRTHHLSKILQSLWEGQDFPGTFQIIVWNNKESRSGTVHEICKSYIQRSNSKKSLELINSTENYFCSVRFAMPALMKSDCLLICDDDVIPGSNFVSFFTSAHLKNPKDVLCVRGHVFLPHELNLKDPSSLWVDYDALRFKNDDAPEQMIHFVHADACLIPKAALREIVSVEMPDASFTLVDDYWMSFVLNHRFGRKLRKLCVAGLSENPINRTDDSDEIGLALHTRPEVQDARLKLYVHHMLQGWPGFINHDQKVSLVNENILKEKKSQFWDNPQLGYNISSKITPKDLIDLCKIGVKSVRIGAVGIGDTVNSDLGGFLIDPEDQLEELVKTVDSLKELGIDVILTLERRLVSSEIWKLISSKFASYPNVVGYDLINEPFSEAETEVHWAEFEANCDQEGLSKLLEKYTELIISIREVDPVTPIIIESSFWGRIHSLSKLPILDLLKIDSNLITSFHFYEPMLLTQRRLNKSRYTFPCPIPLYNDITFSEEINWDENYILNQFQEAKSWADKNGVRVFIGEFGICRDISGAAAYLRAVINSCKTVGISGYVFSFRDGNWEAMDYELGSDAGNYKGHSDWDGNALMDVILEGVNTF